MNHKFFFPLNYDYNMKLLGILEYRMLPYISIFGLIIFAIVKNLSIAFLAKVAIFIIIFVPPILILNSRVYGEPFYSFLFAIIKYYFRKGIYLYKRVIWCGII